MEAQAAKRPFISRPVMARVAPFAVYMGFLAVEDMARNWAGDVLDPRWLYPVKILAVILTLLYFRRDYTELAVRADSRAWSWGVPSGLLVFVLWINLDWGWMNLGEGTGYNPLGADGGVDWGLVAFRLLGAALIVPVMEELFWRSFLMRWIDHHDFRSWEPARVGLRAVLISSALFAVEHTLWFAGLLAGLVYAWLYRSSGNLWTPTISHATTNLALGVYVLQTGEWQFW